MIVQNYAGFYGLWNPNSWACLNAVFEVKVVKYFYVFWYWEVIVWFLSCFLFQAVVIFMCSPSFGHQFHVYFKWWARGWFFMMRGARRVGLMMVFLGFLGFAVLGCSLLQHGRVEKIEWHCLQVVCSGISEEKRLVPLSIAYLQVVVASVWLHGSILCVDHYTLHLCCSTAFKSRNWKHAVDISVN